MAKITESISLTFKKTLNFIAPFYGLGSTAWWLEPLKGGSLIFTIKFSEIPEPHFIDFGRLKGWVDLAAIQWSYYKTVTGLKTTVTKMSNTVPRQVISGRGNSVLPFLVHTTRSKNYNNSNWFDYMAVYFVICKVMHWFHGILNQFGYGYFIYYCFYDIFDYPKCPTITTLKQRRNS